MDFLIIALIICIILHFKPGSVIDTGMQHTILCFVGTFPDTTAFFVPR